ncbi:AI-2E family transporter [Allofustis seminis]|uniref:AI-2E family transporter n=1 Tax=Allofustis seminis TaxID=166939 RepID=UPI0003729939|nr:AI-2E family transporter [Allofustis seminis]
MHDDHPNHKNSRSWFYHDILNNRLTTTLLIIFLLILSLYLIMQMKEIFVPIEIALSIIAPPFLVATLFFYLLNPLIKRLTRYNLSRNMAIIIVFVGIVAVMAGFIHFLVPIVRAQFDTLAHNVPIYIDKTLAALDSVIAMDAFSQTVKQLQSMDVMNQITEHGQNLFNATLGSIGSVIGAMTTLSITLLTAPFVLYYMLVDGGNFKDFLVRAFPTKARPYVDRFLIESHKQVGSYIRGQLIVAICVAIMFYIGYSIIGLEYALLLSINAGILNMVPYLGSILSAVPALIIGFFVSPVKALQVALVLVIEQTLEGRVISPLVLGNSLEIHPLVILFILLISGGIFGVMGVLLAVPGYAILKILVTMVFDYLKENTELYHE